MELYAVTIVAFAGLSIVLTQAENTYYRACPSHYYYDSNTEKCYGNYTDTELTWDKAREHCQSEGGDLIVTNGESTSGYGYLQRLNNNINTPRLWLGLREIATTGDNSEFRWIDGSPLEYEVWATGHPSDRNTSVCVERVYDKNSGQYLWKDLHCSEKIPFVCERPSDFFWSCRSFFKSHSERKKCIKLRQRRSTWHEARNVCQNLGGDLVVIPDETYNTFIKEMLWNEQGYWIGLRNVLKNTTTTTGSYEFKWVDGSSLDFYNDWHLGQPDYEGNSDSTDVIDAGDICGAFDNFRWGDQSCNSIEKYHICEQDFNEPLVCPGDDWTVNTRNRMCYKIQTTNKNTFDDARALCQQEGGDLANIADAETKTFLSDRIQPTDDFDQFWVGLIITNGNRIFGWLDGSSFDESERAIFGSEGDKECATFNFRHDKMRYADKLCTREFYSICHKFPLRNYPLVECPQGYIFTETKDSRVKCVIGQSNPKSLSEAVDDCSKMGSELFSTDDQEASTNKLVVKQLLSLVDVWSTNNSCETYIPATGAFELRPCNEEYPYLCQTWGNMTTTVVNMRNVVSLSLISDTDSVLPVGGNNDSALLVSDVCKASSLTELYTIYKWTMNSSSTVSIFTGTNFVQLVLENKNATCQVYEKEPCCVLVNLKSSNMQTEISFPMDQILCACLPEEPLLDSIIDIDATQNTTNDIGVILNTNIDIDATPNITIDNESTQITTTSIETTQSTTVDNESTQVTTIDNETTQNTTISIETTQSTAIDNEATQSTTIDNEATQNTTIDIEATREAVSYLRNLTTPKNNSAVPNNLCPCRCDSVGIDFNPSPQTLAEIIFNIQKELKIDTEQLSQQRNKKISAPDRRTESQAMGYVGIVIALIPVCLLVALDLTRLFTTNTDT